MEVTALAMVTSGSRTVRVAVAGVLDDRWQLAPTALVAALLLLSALVRRFRRSSRVAGSARITGTLFALGLLVGSALIYLYPPTDLPEPSGPHAVGVTDFALADASRPGLLAAEADEPRKLLVRVWYPAVSAAELPVRPYFTEAEADTTGNRESHSIGDCF